MTLLKVIMDVIFAWWKSQFVLFKKLFGKPECATLLALISRLVIGNKAANNIGLGRSTS